MVVSTELAHLWKLVIYGQNSRQWAIYTKYSSYLFRQRIWSNSYLDKLVPAFSRIENCFWCVRQRNLHWHTAFNVVLFCTDCMRILLKSTTIFFLAGTFIQDECICLWKRTNMYWHMTYVLIVLCMCMYVETQVHNGGSLTSWLLITWTNILTT